MVKDRDRWLVDISEEHRQEFSNRRRKIGRVEEGLAQNTYRHRRWRESHTILQVEVLVNSNRGQSVEYWILEGKEVEEGGENRVLDGLGDKVTEVQAEPDLTSQERSRDLALRSLEMREKERACLKVGKEDVGDEGVQIDAC